MTYTVCVSKHVSKLVHIHRNKNNFNNFFCDDRTRVSLDTKLKNYRKNSLCLNRKLKVNQITEHRFISYQV